MTISEVNKKVAEDAFSFNSLRLVAKVASINPQAYRLIAEDPYNLNETIPVDIFLLRQKQIEAGKVYEFLGEIEQIKPESKDKAAAQNDDNDED